MSPHFNGHLTGVELSFTASLPQANRRKDWLAHIEQCGLCELSLASMEGRHTTATWNPWGEQPNRGDSASRSTPNG